MSCAHAHQLETVAAGEAPPALEAEVAAHARGCQRCRQELQWLKTEQALFRLRAGRDEVAHLWQGVARRRGFAPPRAWGRVLGGLAAAAVLVVGLGLVAGRGAPGSEPAAAAFSASEPGVSVDPVSFPVDDASEPCSRLPEGVGFHCTPALQASTLASR